MARSGGLHITFSTKKLRPPLGNREFEARQLPSVWAKQPKNISYWGLPFTVFFIAYLGIVMLLLITASSVGADEKRLELKFDVFLNGKLMGWHSYRVSESNGFTDVQSRTKLDGRIFVFKQVDYAHQSNERWSDGCLQKLESDTISGRKKTSIEGWLTEDGFLIKQNGSSRLLPACTRTFAYWEPKLLKAEFLLNPDSGEHLKVTYDKKAVVDGFTLTLTTPKEPIYLKYDNNGNWLELESRLKSIVPIRYQRSLPL